MNEDTILDIISHCSSTEIAKFRLLNKACNKRTYEFFFINRHLRVTNSVFGYFIQSYKRFRYRSSFVSCIEEEEEAPGNNGISLEFLPSRDVKIEACDTHHGILLCVDNDKFKGGRRIPDYIVCKPATKQYRIIPNPKTRYFTIATGLVVIRSNQFRYKIVKVSKPMPWERRKTKEGFCNLNCEVF
ncbi:F-box protein At5g41720 [Eutrema salsugineum]|uniref:F-box protein At5g41720 n=1 Tax=Eutrema salsugineum TaxID=72664 RepID=UPI000CED640C|nr:F-box protein At5g41720 [Eutrema salsugineum]